MEFNSEQLEGDAFDVPYRGIKYIDKHCMLITVNVYIPIITFKTAKRKKPKKFQRGVGWGSVIASFDPPLQ